MIAKVRQFWTSPKGSMLLSALLPIPVLVGLFLVFSGEKSVSTPLEEAVTTPAREELPEPPSPAPEDAEMTSPGLTPETMLEFMARVEAAHPDSKLHGAKSLFRRKLPEAKAMELIGTAYFASGEHSLRASGIAAMAAEFQKHDALRDPKAIVVVLGYADQAGDETTNNAFALERAQTVESAIRGFHQGATYSWFVGETDRFGAEADLNRVAEVWMILPRDDMFAAIGSDELLPQPAPRSTPVSQASASAPVYGAAPVKQSQCVPARKVSERDTSYFQSIQYRRLQMLRRRSCN